MRLERRSPKAANDCSSKPHRLEKPRPTADQEAPRRVSCLGDRRTQQAASRLGRKPATAATADGGASQPVGQIAKTPRGVGSMGGNPGAIPEAPLVKRRAGMGPALCACPGALAAPALGGRSLALVWPCKGAGSVRNRPLPLAAAAVLASATGRAGRRSRIGPWAHTPRRHWSPSGLLTLKAVGGNGEPMSISRIARAKYSTCGCREGCCPSCGLARSSSTAISPGMPWRTNHSMWNWKRSLDCCPGPKPRMASLDGCVCRRYRMSIA